MISYTYKVVERLPPDNLTDEQRERITQIAIEHENRTTSLDNLFGESNREPSVLKLHTFESGRIFATLTSDSGFIYFTRDGETGYWKRPDWSKVFDDLTMPKLKKGGFKYDV